MVSKSELLEKFQITGCENLSEEVLEKCMELCHWFDKDEEEFVDMWVAFGIQHLDGNLEPTLKALEEMRRVTPRSKQKDDDNFLKRQKEQTKSFYNNNSKQDIWMDDEDEILGAYVSSEKLALMQTKRPRSPDPEDSGVDGCKVLAAECTPTSLEPVLDATITASQSFSQRSTVGSKVLMTVGPKIQNWSNEKKYRCTIRRAGPHVPPDARYMFELLKTTSEVRTRVCRQIGYQVNFLWAEKKKDDVIVTPNVRTRHQQDYRTWGRVCFESETKQSKPTILLEGCRKPPRSNTADAKFWPQVELDVSEVRECTLFPGQILAVEGLNLSESLIKVHDIFNGSYIPAAKPPHLTEELKIVIAAGPFTPSNDLSFQPLWELMSQVAEEEPNLLILIGPFLDVSHPEIQGNSINCTYQEYFNKLILKIKQAISGKCTQVVLVASSRDVHHHAVYPTPEYFLPKFVQCPEIHVLPDPCTLDIDGLRLSMTSIDCLMHLGREEVVMKSGMDKLSRLGNYILNQACFYPLYPPAKELNIDSLLWEKYAFLKEKPHMLILPSDMRYFCKNINESMILNPERLSKRTFTRINVKPPTENSWSSNNISCEIIKM